MRKAPLLFNALFVLNSGASALSFHGVASLHSFDAPAKVFSGEARIDGEKLESASGKVTIEVSDIDTGIGGRNVEMRRRLEADKYKQIVFTLKSASRVENKTSDGRVIDDLGSGESKCALQGELKVKDRTAKVEGIGRCVIRGSSWRVEGEAPVDMRAFAIEPPHVAFISMDPIVTVKYALEFKQK